MNSLDPAENPSPNSLRMTPGTVGCAKFSPPGITTVQLSCPPSQRCEAPDQLISFRDVEYRPTNAAGEMLVMSQAYYIIKPLWMIRWAIAWAQPSQMGWTYVCHSFSRQVSLSYDLCPTGLFRRRAIYQLKISIERRLLGRCATPNRCLRGQVWAFPALMLPFELGSLIEH